MTLDEIGLKAGTDKNSERHCYLDNYEKHLGHLRNKEFVMLEIGVASGNSIRMWREYFTKAKVYGIDIDPNCAGEGIFIGNATDPAFLESVLAQIGTPFVVVDDGGHVGHETMQTFKLLFPRISDSGFYFVEDTATYYNNHYSGEFESNGRTKVYNFFTDLAYHVDVAGRAMTGNQEAAINSGIQDPPVPEYSRILASIHIHPSLWLYKRK